MSSIPSRAHDTDTPERWEALERLDDWLRTPMLVLSFAWLLLVVIELAMGSSRLLETFGTAIWIVFILEFALRFALAPAKMRFLQHNWLTALALLVPALRLFRALRILSAARGLRGFRLVRIVGTADRGMGALRVTLERRRMGFVVAMTMTVLLLGAGGMLAFEPGNEVQGGLAGYLDALWWTAMLLTTMGSEYWPKTPEGRILCLMLSLYGFAVFGYITASFASFFVGRDSEERAETVAPAVNELAAIRREIAALRATLADRAP